MSSLLRTVLLICEPMVIHPKRRSCRIFDHFQVEGGRDKTLSVSGKLPEARCRFALDGTRTNSSIATSQTMPLPPGDKRSNAGGETSAADGGCSDVLDFGLASVGVEVTRTVLLHNVGKSPAVFFVDTEELRPVRGRERGN